MSELRSARVTDAGYAFGDGGGDADAVARYADGASLRLFVPSEDVLLTTVTLPARTRRDRLRALPFALEERVCGDDLHYALGEPVAGDALPVAVVSRTRMDAWLAPLAERGVSVASMLPDCFALPCEDGAWHAQADSDRLVLRTGPASGCAFDRDVAPAVLARLLRDAPPGTLYLPVDIRDREVLAALARERGWGVEPPGVRTRLGTGDPRIPDLLQGAYAPTGRAHGWRAYRLAAALLVAAFVLHVGASYARALDLEAQARAERAANEATFRRLFPSTRRIVDMRLQASQSLAAQQAAQAAGGDFLRLFLASGEALNAVPGRSLTEIAYADGVLELGLVTTDLSLLENYAGTLAARQLNAEILGATRNSDGIAGRLRIREVSP